MMHDNSKCNSDTEYHQQSRDGNNKRRQDRSLVHEFTILLKICSIIDFLDGIRCRFRLNVLETGVCLYPHIRRPLGWTQLKELVPISGISIVGIATGCGLDDRGVGVRVPVGSRCFSFPRYPDRLWGPPNLLANVYRRLFPRK
jgi:hypothetical protein